MHTSFRIVASALLVLSPIAGAQQDNAPPSQADAEPEIYAPVARSLQDLRPGRTVLLREGSVLVRTVGTVAQDAQGRWILTITADETDGERREAVDLILMPCRVLEEMQRIVRSAEAQTHRFEITGEVFVYNDRNYFLPTHAPHIVEQTSEAPADRPRQPEPGVDTTVGGDDGAAGDDSAESIMQRLREKAGSVSRSTAPPDALPPLDAERTAQESTLREGMSLMDRRGHLTRRNDGSWEFVFDADAEGLSDPPVTVLPCLLLERMERYARSRSNVAPILLSGRVFEYRNRNYVLPTLYRVPHERTPITP